MFHKKKEAKDLKFQIKEWFILIEDNQEGPFSLQDLKNNYYFTPDTLVWKKGFQEWVAARFVAELKEVFKDEKTTKKNSDLEIELKNSIDPNLGQDQATLAMQQDPYQFLLWLLILIIILFYTFYQLYY